MAGSASAVSDMKDKNGIALGIASEVWFWIGKTTHHEMEVG
jgi:hypothetical protein